MRVVTCGCGWSTEVPDDYTLADEMRVLFEHQSGHEKKEQLTKRMKLRVISVSLDPSHMVEVNLSRLGVNPSPLVTYYICQSDAMPSVGSFMDIVISPHVDEEPDLEG